MHTKMTNETMPVTSSSHLASAIEAANRYEVKLNAFIFRPDSYPNQCREGALSGIPIAVKDLIDTADMPTAYGSKIFEGYQPTKDAWVVQRLRELGAVIFGKTVTTEFAWRDPGMTVNPWNANYTPGGSSSGSAAAVAAGIVDVALGTQTVGSIIRPASYCGIVGYKPTYGMIPRDGVRVVSPTLDHVGFLTSNCRWAAMAYSSVTQGKSAQQPLPDMYVDEGKKPAKLGMYRSSRWAYVDPDVKNNFDAVIRLLQEQGIECVDVGSELNINEIVAMTHKIMAYEVRQNLYQEIKGKLSQAGPYTREIIQQGESVSKQEYEQLMALLTTMRKERDAVLEGVDAIISITSPTEALLGLEKTGDASFCAPWTFLGLPALTIPSGLSSSLLPLGVQLIGRGGEDMPLIMIGQWLSTLLPRIRCPALLADHTRIS